MPGAVDDKVRVLVVDDSIFARREIRRVVESSGHIQVIGEAGNGDEALRAARDKQPDAITLDLEMPRMDGFTFLRILMSREPVPVIVVSSHGQRENVFRALEVGALDFVEKPENGRFSESNGRLLVDKIMLAKTLRPQRLVVSHPSVFGSEPTTGMTPVSSPILPPRFIIAIAASTGGPAALLDIFSRLPARLPAAIVVAQHMPQRFTGPFAARLAKRSSLNVREASDGDIVLARNAYVCPGGYCMEVESNAGDWRIRIVKPTKNDIYIPSADRLFSSVARVAGPRSVGVVLTGMGVDGTEGARAIHEARGLVVVESQDTAIVDGMPSSVVRAGITPRVLPLAAIGELLGTLA